MQKHQQNKKKKQKTTKKLRKIKRKLIEKLNMLKVFSFDFVLQENCG